MRQSGLRSVATLCAVLAWGGGWLPHANAANSKTIDMTLTVLINGGPPCTITGGDVEFGNVTISKIDGSNYAQPINYSLNCGSRAADGLKLQIQGTATTINGESVLKTSVNGLGLQLKATSGGTLLTPGTSSWLNFQCKTTTCGPALQATPVKASGTTLAAGEFSASATLVVEYQ